MGAATGTATSATVMDASNAVTTGKLVPNTSRRLGYLGDIAADLAPCKLIRVEINVCMPAEDIRQLGRQGSAIAFRRVPYPASPQP